MLLELLFFFWKKNILQNLIYEKELESFNFEKRKKDYIIVMENLKKKCFLEEKKDGFENFMVKLF